MPGLIGNVELIFQIQPHIYIINVIISQFLWVRFSKCQFTISNKVKGLILIGISVKHFNFGSNKIVELRKGQCSLAFLL